MNNNNEIQSNELSKLLQLVNIIKKALKDFYASVQLNNPHSGDFTEFNKKLSEITANINMLKMIMLNLNYNNNDVHNIDGMTQWSLEKSKAEGTVEEEERKEKNNENIGNDENDEESISSYILKDELKNSIYEVIKINDALSNFINKSINYNQQTISFIVNLFNKDYLCDYNKNASYNKSLKRSVCLVKDIHA
jgi:hypothetical protein